MSKKPGSQIEKTSKKADEKKEVKKVKKKNKAYRKIGIIGSASSTLGLCPWHDFELEIWGLGWRALPRVDRLFDLHPDNFNKKDRINVQKNYEERLASFKDVPIYLTKEHPEIPNSIRYPIEDIFKFMGVDLDPYTAGTYFASSIAFLICMAIYEAVDEIHLYGIDFVGDGEYEHQRPNMEYLVGVARGKGIKVYIPKGSALCEFSYVYGYQLPPDVGILNRAVILDRLKQYKKKNKEALLLARTTDGAIQECEQLLQVLLHTERGGNLEVPPVKVPVDVLERRLAKEKEQGHDGK